MAVRIRIPAGLRELARGHEWIVLEPAPSTMAEALTLLGQEFPAVSGG